jgi:ATP-dependent Clp endopeptidase proteolytic subunit ClpP
MNDIYNERPNKPQQKEVMPQVAEESPYIQLNEIISNQVELDEGVLYLNDEIETHTLFDLMMRIRRCLKYRESKDYKGTQDAPLNLMINSPGGDIHEMMGIIDYIESLDVKVNMICRGRAFSAASVILTCGTGTRMMSKNSTIMFHQASSMISGKLTDVTNTIDFVKRIEGDIYELLSKKTKKDAAWWKEQMRSDLFLTSEQALEIGVIDQII